MLPIQDFIQTYLDHAAPWIALWIGAVTLDMVFGGPRALGLVPSLDGIITRSVHFLQSRLERQTRSRRAHFWRGALAAVVLVIGFALMGYGIDQLVFYHPALTAVAVFFVAKFLSLKITWHQMQKSLVVAGNQPTTGDDQCRRLARRSIELFANNLVAAMILFVVGGFTVLLPFVCLQAASLAAEKTESDSFFLRPFQRIRSVAAIPGEMLGTGLLAIALLLWPAANWGHGWLSVFRFGGAVKLWPLTMVAYAFNWSFERNGKDQTGSGRDKWIGPTGGSAQLKPADVKNALIVALIAFGVTNALMGLLWLAATIG